MAYLIAIVLMFLKVFLMIGIGILNLFSSSNYEIKLLNELQECMLHSTKCLYISTYIR